MSGVQNKFIILVVLLIVSNVDLVSVPRICGRVEIGRQHGRPKVFHVTEVKHAKFNLTHSVMDFDKFSPNSLQTQFFQPAKKQSKRIYHGSRLSKKQRKIMSMLWTKSKTRRENNLEKLYKNPKEYKNMYTYYVSAPYSKTIRNVKKIKRQDMINYSQNTSTQGVSELPKNIYLQNHLAATENGKNKKVQFMQYLKKKSNLPRLAPFTSKPFRTMPTYTGFRESYLLLTALGDSYKNFQRTVSNNNKQSGGEGKAATRKNRHRKISFYWVPDNVTDQTTVKDKVKFFEIYDQFTPAGKRKKAEVESFDLKIDINPQQNAKVFLDDVNQDISHIDDNYLYSKREYVKRDNSGVSNRGNANLQMNDSKAEHMCCKKRSQNSKNEIQKGSKLSKENSNNSGATSWAEYPFTAVYIYEPSQVHCDAAALSAHWLVAGGACLYRRQRDVSLEERSAFVTYCGANWRVPERIAYVKLTLVHPEYHPRDQKRRRQFNIGLIQVEYSMQLSCAGWSPVTLLSKPFVADPMGSPATAVGWGLDSYAGLDSTTDLARLMRYDGKIYTEVCPANPQLSKLVQLSTKANLDPDVYCLPLPHRNPNVEEDPSHGNLLLSGGKLIALYFSEEQRPWAERWAQYTSIWRLAMWVRETALEPKVADNFTVVDI